MAFSFSDDSSWIFNTNVPGEIVDNAATSFPGFSLFEGVKFGLRAANEEYYGRCANGE